MEPKKDSPLNIPISHLKDGACHTLTTDVGPEMLALDESEVKANGPVQVTGKAYLVADELLLRFSAKTTVVMPCSVCNSPATVCVYVADCVEAIPLEEIRRDTYDATVNIREELVLQIPQFTECQGKCPERDSLAIYTRSADKDDSDTYNPFSELQ